MTFKLLLCVAVLLGTSLVVDPSFVFASNGFIENRGQLPPAVRYYALGWSAAIYLTESAVVLDLREPSGVRDFDTTAGPRWPGDSMTGIQRESQGGCALYLRFEGVSQTPRLEARRKLSAHVNYFLGSDQSRWRTDVPVYAEVVYHEVWPGIDLVFHDQDEGLAYEIVATGGEETVKARLLCEGAGSITQRSRSEIWYDTPVGRIVHLQPEGRAGKGWLLVDTGRQKETPAADSPGLRDNPDALRWSTLLGGSSSDGGRALALDDSDQAFVYGTTMSSDFPTTPGAYDRTYGNNDDFVALFSLATQTLLWSTFIGGSGQDDPQALALDSAGNPVIVGVTFSSDFPTTVGAYDRTFGGVSDVYVTKLSSSGSALIWSSLLGAGQLDIGLDLALDAAENVVICGYTASSDFPTTAGAYDRSFAGGSYDSFVAKLSTSGSSLLWSTFLGGNSFDHGSALTLDSAGNVVSAGMTYSSDFPTTPGAYDQTYNGSGDWYVATLSSSGQALLSSTYLGGTSADEFPRAVVLDDSENPLVVGSTFSSNFPSTANAYDPSHNGSVDIVVAKLSSTASALLWSTFLGGSSSDYGFGMTLDSGGNPTITGNTSSTDFPTTAWAYDRSYNGGTDAIVARLSASGDSLLWSSYLGGSGSDNGYGLGLDSAGHVVIAGDTRSSDFPIVPSGAAQPAGMADVFVSQLDLSLDPLVNVEAPDGPDTRLMLFSPTPNPSLGRVALQFHVPESRFVSLSIYDPAGRLVEEVVGENYAPGSHRTSWNPFGAQGRYSSGVYLARLRAGGEVATQKIILCR